VIDNLLSIDEYKKKTKKRNKKSYEIPDYMWAYLRIARPKIEFPFFKEDKKYAKHYRFDYAWPEIKMAVEVEGIFYNPKQGKSRHQTAVGYIRDTKKYNAAAELGWVVLRYVPGKIDFSQIKNVYVAKVSSLMLLHLQTGLTLDKDTRKKTCGKLLKAKESLC
jgi:hypothetical protein